MVLIGTLLSWEVVEDVQVTMYIVCSTCSFVAVNGLRPRTLSCQRGVSAAGSLSGGLYVVRRVRIVEGCHWPCGKRRPKLEGQSYLPTLESIVDALS